MKKGFFVLGLLIVNVIFSEFVFAATESYNDAFSQAAGYYAQQDYEAAIQQYNRILKDGWESGNLYYNLGNCYFKQGKLGWAIFYYEKARQLIPRDRDLESNYEYALSLIEAPFYISKSGIAERLFSAIFSNFTIDGLTVLLVICYIMILVGFLVAVFLKNQRRSFVILLVILCLIFLGGFWGLYKKISLLGHQAVVVEKQADVKFEPLEKATDYFTLYEGMKVRIIALQDNWYKIRRQDGKCGWVRKDSLAVF